MEARLVSIQTAEFDHLARPRLPVGDQFLVLKLEKAVGQQI
jgi:hypothetical protein